MKKACSILILAVFASATLESALLFAADLDDVYGHLLRKDVSLYAGDGKFFAMNERGTHGNPAFDKFDSDPYFFSMDNAVRLAPWEFLEIGAGYNETFPASYKRLTYNPAGMLVGDNTYFLDHLRDYDLAVRARPIRANIEVYADAAGKRQKARWDYAPSPAQVNVNTVLHTRYNDFTAGLRFILGDDVEEGCSDLSLLKGRLLGAGQFTLDAATQYRSGIMERETYYLYFAQWYYFNYRHDLKEHLAEHVMARYGVLDSLELEAGVSYTWPVKYRYEYRLFYPRNFTRFTGGTYKLRENFTAPLRLKYRPVKDMEISLSSDFRTAYQRLDYYDKGTDNVTRLFPSKRLHYYNLTPQVACSYLYSYDKKISEDGFADVTKYLLKGGQCLIECFYRQDITHLEKSDDNGSQNIIDPYGIFQYPLDYFVAGTEHSSFLTGNTSNFATDIMPQNFYSFGLGLTYGLTDWLNAGVKASFRSRCFLEHFVLNELKSRHYGFRPLYTIDGFCDWRLTKNSILSLNSHVVPTYITTIDREGDVEGYKSRVRYIEASVSLKVAF